MDEDMSLDSRELSFPTVGVMPKQETGAAMFLEQYPDYDGRDVVVAIFDTGCDPGSDGLRTTPDGKPKFVDVIDATGSGDVDTTSIVKMDTKTRIVTGLTGRQLKIPESWQINEENEFRVGLFRCYDVFPKTLVRRLNRERSKKFDEIHTKKLDNLRGQIENMQQLLKNEKKTPKNTDDKNKDDTSEVDKNPEKNENNNGNGGIDLKSRIEDSKKFLAQLEKELCVNCGAVFDVLVWNNGNGEWLAYLDTSSATAYYNCESFMNNDNCNIIDLTLFENVNQPMTNFRVRQELNKISEFDNCNYVLNIYDDGDCVSVVVPAGSHGTHVAGIVGGYFKEDSTKNGIAPGCRLVSVKIGDSRLGSMETNQGLLRGLACVKELKVDLVNMSYGEPTTFPFYGAFPDAISELVWKYGTIFVSSAGNDGPCLTTAGAPQASTPSIIGIGAIFSSNMVEAEYCLANSKLPLNSYTWSSRGPTTGGALGVKLCAPGGAIAPVPTFTLNKHQLMNGTSMSSPNACGNIALLLSGLKAKSINYTPNGIETALINTAKLLANVEALSVGYGLIQIHKAFDYCCKKECMSKVVELPVHYDISVSGGPNNTAHGEKGIYIRECNLLNIEYSYNVFVNPVFHDNYSNEEKTGFEFKCSLKSSEPNWIKCANFAMLAHGGRGFQVKVDTRQFKKFINSNNNNNLKENGYKAFYSGEILGFDSTNLSAGPLFRVPITVVNPIVYNGSSKHVSLSNGFLNNLSLSGTTNNNENDSSSYVFKQIDNFKVGTISRVFHSVPQGVCAAKISIKALRTGNDKPTRFSFATMYTKKYQTIPFDRWFRATTGSTHQWMFKVEPQTVLETTVTQYAMDENDCRLEWCVEFVGPCISSDHIYLNENSHFTEITMNTNIIEANNLKPSVAFDRYNTYVAPKFATTGTLSANRGDVTMNDELYYYLELEYEFDSECKGDTIFTIPKIADLLYDSFVCGAFYMVFDKNKKLIGSGDSFREEIKLDKMEKYLYKIQIRHTSLTLLNSLKTMKLSINYPLSPSISSDLFNGKRSMIQNKNKVSTLKLAPYSHKKLYIASPSKDVSIKNIKPGDHISGWLKLHSGESNFCKPRFRNTGCKGPASYCIPIECVLGAANSKSKTVKSRNDDKDKDKKDSSDEENVSLEEKQRDMMIDWIKKLKGKEQLEAFEKYILNDLLKKYSSHLPLLELQMNVYNSVKDKKDREKYVSMIVDTADAILSIIDQNGVAAHFGRNGDSEDKEWVKADKKYKDEKNLIIKALLTKLKIIYETLCQEEKELEATVVAEAALDSAIADSDGKQDEKSSDIVVVTTSASGGGGSDVNDDIMISGGSQHVCLSKSKLEGFGKLIKELKQWADLDKDKTCKDDYFEIKLWHLKQQQKYGEIFSLVSGHENGDAQKNYDNRLQTFKKYFGKQFGYLVHQKELARYQEFPTKYRLF